MVGGIVIGIARGADETLLHVQGTGGEHNDTKSTRVVERRKLGGEPVVIEIGDSVWWQDRTLYWTPAAEIGGSRETLGGVKYDVALERVGFSH